MLNSFPHLEKLTLRGEGMAHHHEEAGVIGREPVLKQPGRNVFVMVVEIGVDILSSL